MFHSVQHVTGAVLWSNLHLLFWLCLLMSAVAYFILVHARTSRRASARIGRAKSRSSLTRRRSGSRLSTCGFRWRFTSVWPRCGSFRIAASRRRSAPRSAPHRLRTGRVDVKSANIVVTPEGRIKVLDFGLARQLRSAADDVTAQGLTTAGTLMGTVQYMAPEAIREAAATAAADIWSFGIVMFEMLTGRLPFQGRSWFELSSAIVHDPSPPLPDVARSGLRSVVIRCLEKEPSHRYGNGAELRDALGGIDSRTSDDVGQTVLSLRPERIRALAVLPLQNVSASDEEYFVDGLTEALIETLAQIGALRIVSRTSAMAYKRVQRPLPEIARELNVDALIEGSVARVGDRVRITARLIDAVTDTRVWGATYERDVRDILALQGEVAQAVAGEIRLTLTPREEERLAVRPAVRPDVYDLYLRGRYHWNKRSIEGMRKGLAYFEQALALDDEYALAHVGVGDCYVMLGAFGGCASRVAGARAATAASRALQLDPLLAEAHATLGIVRLLLQWEWASAEAALRRAIELNYSYAAAHNWYANCLAAQGRIVEAVAEARRAVELDPLNVTWNMGVGHFLYYQRRFDEAIAQELHTLEMDPAFTMAYWVLGLSYEQIGRLDLAIDTFERGRRAVATSPLLTGVLARAYGLAGRSDAARALLAEVEREPAYEHMRDEHVALVHAGLGEADAAMESLFRAAEARGYRLIFLQVSPLFDTLRHHPRFPDLVRQLKLS